MSEADALCSEIDRLNRELEGAREAEYRLRSELEKAQTEASAMRGLVDMWEHRAYEQTEDGGKARNVIGRLQNLLRVGLDGPRWSDDNMNAVYDAVRELVDRAADAQQKVIDTQGVIDSLRSELARYKYADGCESDRLRDELDATKRELDLIRDAEFRASDKVCAENGALKRECGTLHEQLANAREMAALWEGRYRSGVETYRDVADAHRAERDRADTANEENERLTGELERAEDAARRMRCTLDGALAGAAAVREERDGLRGKVTGLQVERAMLRSMVARATNTFPRDVTR